MQPVVTASVRADLGCSNLPFYGVITDAIGQSSAALAVWRPQGAGSAE
tara:strand:+ start:249 stop:392 length:144 start_codon:yes stop_codon:yes gene_type:complete